MLTYRTVIYRKWNTWRQFSLTEQLWFLPVWLLLGLCRLAILTIPFRHIAPFLGYSGQITLFIPLISGAQQARALHIGQVIATAAGYTPWESKCLVQAMVARILLGLYGIPYAFYLGVTKGEDSEMQAHAWVCTGPVRVTGGESFSRYAVVGSFFTPDHAITSENKIVYSREKTQCLHSKQ